MLFRSHKVDEKGKPVTAKITLADGVEAEEPIFEEYETGEVSKGVKYSLFVPMLITAVQELKAKNDALEARLAALDSKALPATP